MPRRLVPALLSRQVAIGQVAIGRDVDGAPQVVFTRRTVRRGRDAIDLVVVPWAGGEPRDLTGGPSRDVAPAVSPDGRLVAFLSDRGGGRSRKTQAYVVALGGGAPRRVTALPRGVSEVAWTARGDLVVVAQDGTTTAEVRARRGEEPTARVVRRIDWRVDGEGLRLHPANVHLVRLADAPADRLPEAVRLTGSERSASGLVVLGDDAVFLRDDDPDGDLRPAAQPFRVPLAGGDVAPLPTIPGGAHRLAVAPDGALHAIGLPVAGALDEEPTRAFRLDGDAWTPLAPGLDRWVGVGGTDTDLHDWHVERSDAAGVWNVADAGRVVPWRFDGGAPPAPLVDPALDPVAHSAARAGDLVVAVMTLGVRAAAPDVYALEAEGPRRLTTVGDWLAGLELPVVRELEAPGPGGPVRTFLVEPPGAAAGPLPTVLLPHGGPIGQWSCVPTIEALLLASAGVRVAMPNIRGSYDRGRAWQGALFDAWGDVDAADCHAVLDHLVADGLADADRLGVTGLSYGGFLVNWLVGTSDRFRAAVSENGVTNNVSAWANSDCGAPYSEAAGLGDTTTPEGVERLWRQSPLRHVAAIRTPLLILQAEADVRCPAADAEQLFTALRWLRREVEYVLYPEESHPFQGSGRFDRRLDRHRRVLAWLLPRLGVAQDGTVPR